MTTLHNEIVIDAPIERIWEALAQIENLEKYDPTVKKSTAVTTEKKGIGAKRKVDMLDGKNWFEEKVTQFEENEKLAYELTACSFPINQLKHSYSFHKTGNQIKVIQVMEYEVKFGLFGRLLDLLMIRKQSNSGIKKFFNGLKEFAEKEN